MVCSQIIYSKCVTPVFKKKDKLEFGNYTDLFVYMSKIFEGVLCDLMAAYFRNIMTESAFRPGFDYEHVLMRPAGLQ